MTCEPCEGTGSVTYGCNSCSGSGEGMYDGSTCRKCKGQGDILYECDNCSGTGEVEPEEEEENESPYDGSPEKEYELMDDEERYFKYGG